MSKELSTLMTAAFRAADAEYFENEALNAVWRKANQEYVIARDSKNVVLLPSVDPKELSPRHRAA